MRFPGFIRHHLHLKDISQVALHSSYTLAYAPLSGLTSVWLVMNDLVVLHMTVPAARVQAVQH